MEELQQRIMEEWERLDQRVIDNAVKQWRKRLHACVAATVDILTSVVNVTQLLLIMLSFIVT